MTPHRTALSDRHVAYFSMEIGLKSSIPTYSGGLGGLAGDTLRAAADLGVPMVAVTLLYRKGYFEQSLDVDGRQSEAPVHWSPEDQLQRVSETVTVSIEGRPIKVRAWRFDVEGVTGHVVPVYLLDTALAENSAYAQTLTDCLYGGDERYRLCQETLLGVGGVALLRALGFSKPSGEVFHMNEGHSALLTLALLSERLGTKPLSTASEADVAWVRERCIFTTHTPVPAGHDRFGMELVGQVLGKSWAAAIDAFHTQDEGCLNMTLLALRFSRFVNGVAKRHAEVSREMFPGVPISAITNGVHVATWASAPVKELFDRLIPGWRQDSFYLRYALDFPVADVLAAHAEAKRQLFADVSKRAGVALDPKVLTIGFARRATPYKRADLLFADPTRLEAIAARAGGLQIVYAGKAHPRDMGGKALIQRVVSASRGLKNVTVTYLENYDMTLAGTITAGVDIWLNTPTLPLEASGTSGMKAAVNGVPSLSTLDGWWVEGHIENVTGWVIDDPERNREDSRTAAASLYEKLEKTIVPLYNQDRLAFGEVMRAAMSLNGSFFSTHRMMLQYVIMGYGLRFNP